MDVNTSDNINNEMDCIEQDSYSIYNLPEQIENISISQLIKTSNSISANRDGIVAVKYFDHSSVRVQINFNKVQT